ncbi:MAG: c-type cytochrome [Haloferula sp.]
MFFVTCLAGGIHAQDGGQLYATYCSACHATDGKGATGGLFPPLAGSEWVAGPPDRAIKIVLHGLQGPIDVAGKPYNLVMPPQGTVLPDDQIAAILSFVRSSWGNDAAKVTPEQVKAIRTATAERSEMWTQKELLKLHPLPKAQSVLKNLISTHYHGTWKKLPDFSKLEPVAVEEEHDGIISLRKTERKDHFGIVWEADFIAPKTSDYIFRFACDDGGRLLLDGKIMLEVHGTGPIGGGRTQAAKLRLKKGPHPIRIEYYEFTGEEGIAISWKEAASDAWNELSDVSLSKKTPEEVSIPIAPTKDRATIYRNFIAGTTPRAIGIGLPGGINFAYSADHLAPELLWTGKFMDGARHWINRGQGAQKPAGNQLVNTSKSPAFPQAASFRGYRLDPQGNPTFLVTIADLTVSDHFQAGDDELIRVLSASGQGQPIEILISDQQAIQLIDDQIYQFGPSMTLTTEHATIETRDGKTYLKLTPGAPTTLTYTWK